MNAEMNKRKRNPSYVLDELYSEVKYMASYGHALADAVREVRHAPKESEAIYAVPCFLHAKSLGQNPIKAAEEIAEKWNEKISSDVSHPREWFPDSVLDHFEASNGYVNVFVDKQKLHERILKDLRDYGKSYGSYSEIGKTIVVDYCSPNIAKPLTVGHLRSTIIGQALINILRARGYRIEGINFLSDWGTQFGKLLYAFERWGDEEKFSKEPIEHLLDLYVKFHREVKENPELEEEGRAAFKRLEQGGEKERALWQRFKEGSLESFEKTVARLGVCFDHNWFESDFEDKAQELTDELLTQGIAERSEGAVIIRTFDDKPPLVARKSDGTTLYASRDLASALERLERFKPVAKLLYAVGTEQNLHFANLDKALERMGYPDILEHIRFGMVSLPTGKISTREGRVVYLDDLLDEAERRAAQIINEKNPDMPADKRKEVAREVGIGAVIYADLSQDRIKDIVFDWSKMLAFDGNSAPYLQYAAVRCAKILAKAKPEERKPLATLKEEDIPKLVAEIKEPESIELLMSLGWFPQAITEAAERYAPHALASYLYDLATALSRFYTQVPVLRAETDTARLARLCLVDATGLVLRHGLALLGIETPEEM